MRSKSQILSKLRADGHITDEEYKMLKQEPKTDTLDKIRAEIGNLQTFDTEIIYGLIDTTVELREVFRIIDKYRTESEE